MATMAKAAIQTTVRIDPELYERARAVAARNAIPLNTFMAWALREVVEQREADPKDITWKQKHMRAAQG